MIFSMKNMKYIGVFLGVILLMAVTYSMVLQPNIPNAPPLNIGPSAIPGGNNDDYTSNDDGSEPFSGALAVSFSFLNHADLDSVYTTANGTAKIYHADKSTLFGTTTTGATVTNRVNPSDAGMLYLLWQPAATVYLDTVATAANNEYLGTASPFSVEGTDYYLFPFDVSDLESEAGITTALTLNLYLLVADVSGIDYTSSTNATSADYSGTTWITASVDGRISGMTQETSFKLVKVEMSMPDADNITLFDNSKIKDLRVTLGLGNNQQDWVSSTYDHNTGGTYIQFDVAGISDPTQEYYGKPIIYASTDSTGNIDFQIDCKISGFTASNAWVPTLIITYIGPNGATGTFSVPVSFTDT